MKPHCTLLNSKKPSYCLLKIVFLAFLLALGVLVGTNLFSPDLPPSPADTPRELKPETLRLGDPTPLKGTPLVRLPLSQPTDSGYGSLKGSFQTRNLLIVDGSNSKSWWLLPNNQSLVLKTTDFFKLEKGKSESYIASLHEVVPSDSNQDGQITWEDHSKAFLSTPTPNSWREITPDSVRILATQQLNPSQALVIYQTPSETRSKTISIPDGETLTDQPISTLP